MRRVVVVGSQSAVLLNAVHGGHTMGGSRGGFLQYRWKWPRDKFLQLLSNRRANRPREYCESSVCAPACCAAGSRFPSPILHRKRSPSPRVHFVRPFLFKKERCRPVTNLSFPRIRRPIILRPGNVDEPFFFFDKGKYDGGREKRSGRGNKCEIGGGSVGIEASK